MAEPGRIEFGEGEGAIVEADQSFPSSEAIAVELQDFLSKYVTPTWTEEFLHGSGASVPHGVNFSEKYFTKFPPEIHEPVLIAIENYETQYGRGAAFFFIPLLAEQIEYANRVGVEPLQVLEQYDIQAIHKRAIVAKDAAASQPFFRTFIEGLGKVTGVAAEAAVTGIHGTAKAMAMGLPTPGEIPLPSALETEAQQERMKLAEGVTIEATRKSISDLAGAISPVLKEASEDIFGSLEDRASVYSEIAKVYGQTTDQIEEKWEKSLPQNVKDDIVENFRGIAHLASVIWLGGDVAPEDWALPLDEFYQGSLGRGRQLTRTIIGGMVGSVGAIFANIPMSLYTHPFTLAMLIAPIVKKLPANVMSRLPPYVVKSISVLNLIAQIDPIGGPGALLRGAKTLLKSGNKIDVSTVAAMVAQELGLTETQFAERQGAIREAAEQYIGDSKARGNLSEAEIATVIANDPKTAANNIASLLSTLGREASRSSLEIDRHAGTSRGGVAQAERVVSTPAETRPYVADLTRRIREGDVPPPTEPPAGPPPPTEPPAPAAPPVERSMGEIAGELRNERRALKELREEQAVNDQALADAVEEGLTPGEIRALEIKRESLSNLEQSFREDIRTLEDEGGFGGPREIIESVAIEHNAPLGALEPLADILQTEGIVYEGSLGPAADPFMHGFQGTQGKLEGSSFNLRQSRIKEIGLEAAFEEARAGLEKQYTKEIRKYTAKEIDDIAEGRKTEAEVDAKIAAEGITDVEMSTPLAEGRKEFHQANADRIVKEVYDKDPSRYLDAAAQRRLRELTQEINQARNAVNEAKAAYDAQRTAGRTPAEMRNSPEQRAIVEANTARKALLDERATIERRRDNAVIRDIPIDVSASFYKDPHLSILLQDIEVLSDRQIQFLEEAKLHVEEQIAVMDRAGVTGKARQEHVDIIQDINDRLSGQGELFMIDPEAPLPASAMEKYAATPDPRTEVPSISEAQARGLDIEALVQKLRAVGTSKLADPSKTTLIDVRMDDAGKLKTVTEYAEFQRTINDPQFRENAIAVLSEELGMPREEIAARINDEAFVYAFMPEVLPHELVRTFVESDNMALLTDQIAERLSFTFPQKELIISDNMPIVQGIKRSLSDDAITKAQVEQAITSAFRDTAVHQLMRSPKARNIFLGRMKKKHGIPTRAMDNILVDMTNATLFDSPFNYIIELPGGGSLNLLFEMESFFREMKPELFKKVSQEAFQKVSQQITNQVENIKLKNILNYEKNRFNSTAADPKRNMLESDPKVVVIGEHGVRTTGYERIITDWLGGRKAIDATTYIDNVAFKVIGLGEAPPSVLTHNAGELAQRIRSLDPAELAARLAEAPEAKQFTGRPTEASFVEGELNALASRMEAKYTTPDPSLRNILPEGTTGVSKALNRQMRFQRNVISDMSPLYNSLMSLTTLLKGNVTVRNPGTHVNNFTANLMMQSGRTGRMPSSILREAISINRQYQKYLRGTLNDPAMAQTFASIEMSGLIDTDLVDAELTYMNSAISKETTGTPFAHLPEPVANLLRKNFAKETYKMGDQIFKMSEAVRAHKELSGAVEKLTFRGKPGQYVEWEIGGGRKVQIVKKGDGGLGIATYDRGNNATAFLDFIERAKRNDVPDAVRREDISNLATQEMPTGGWKPGEGIILAPDSPLYRALSDGAAHPALNIFFDYADAPLYAMALRQVPVIGLAAPFVTWFYKAMDIPPIPGVTKGKKGLVSHVLLGDGGLVTSNMPEIANGQMVKVAANSARRFALMNAARSQLQDEPELLKDIVMRDKRGSGAALIYETLNPWYNSTVDLENITYYGPTETFFKVGLPAMLSVADNTYSAAQKAGIVPEDAPPSMSAMLYDFKVNDAGRMIIDNSDLEKAGRGGLIDKAQAKIVKNIRDINARRLTGEYMNPQDVLELVGLTGGFLGDILVEVATAEQQDRPVRMPFYIAKFTTLLAGGLVSKIVEAGRAVTDPNDPSILRTYALRPDPYESEEVSRYMVRLFTGAVFAGKKRMTAKQSKEAIKRTVNTMKKALTGDLIKKRDRLAANGMMVAAEAMNEKLKIQMAIFEEEGIRLQRAITATAEEVVGKRIKRLEEKRIEYGRPSEQ